MRHLWTFLGACGLGCGEEFPDDPTGTLTIQVGAGFRDTLMALDTATLVVDIGDGRGNTVTGIEVNWESSDPTLLELKPLPPLSPPTQEDSLTSRLSIQAVAHARGQVEVAATVDRPGFRPAELTVLVTILERWHAVSAGSLHTCAIASDSAAYCWGSGADGRLGRGRPLDDSIPVRVLALGPSKFTGISAGDRTSCGIIIQGLAFCWGAGTQGSLGNGDASEASALVPVQVNGPTFRSVDAGAASCGIADDFVALCWGTNASNQLGFNSNVSPGLNLCSGSTLCSLAPRAVWVDATTPQTYRDVTVGGVQTCGIGRPPRDGQAFCWGASEEGALGNAVATSSETPIPVSGALTFATLSAGGNHTCGTTTSEAAFCWGNNFDGELGNGTTNNSSIPTSVSGGPFVSVSAGRRHTCALNREGLAFCWGLGSAGQLGNGSGAMQTRPTAVSGQLSFVVISAGAFHTCGIVSDGALYCWGQGASGRLGNGSVDDRSTPVRVSEPEI
jgi:Regulator of chromosome condensation (RCC1) repeat